MGALALASAVCLALPEMAATQGSTGAPAASDPAATAPSAPTPSDAAPSVPDAAGPVDCGSLAALLPSTLEGRAVTITVSPGISAIDPDDLLDPLLASLGRTRDDVCVVAFQYGEGQAMAGRLLHIEGAAIPDLAGRFVLALRDRLVEYGAMASAAPTDAAGEPTWQLRITAGGKPSEVMVHGFGDTLLVTSSRASMGRLMGLIPTDPVPGSLAPPRSSGAPG